MQRETLFFQKFNLLCSISLIVFFTQTLAQVAQSCRVQFWCHFHLCCCGLLPRRASPSTCQLKKNKACLNQSMGIIEDKMSMSFPCRSLMVLTWSQTLVVQCIYEIQVQILHVSHQKAFFNFTAGKSHTGNWPLPAYLPTNFKAQAMSNKCQDS